MEGLGWANSEPARLKGKGQAGATGRGPTSGNCPGCMRAVRGAAAAHRHAGAATSALTITNPFPLAEDARVLVRPARRARPVFMILSESKESLPGRGVPTGLCTKDTMRDGRGGAPCRRHRRSPCRAARGARTGPPAARPAPPFRSPAPRQREWDHWIREREYSVFERWRRLGAAGQFCPPARWWHFRRSYEAPALNSPTTQPAPRRLLSRKLFA